MHRILIVDDEEMIRKLIRKYAEFEGHEVVEACDGLDAVTKFRHNDFDLIVMDIMMPELDGFSACREIRKTSNIPIIIIIIIEQKKKILLIFLFSFLLIKKMKIIIIFFSGMKIIKLMKILPPKIIYIISCFILNFII